MGLLHVVESIREPVHLHRDPRTGEITAELAARQVAPASNGLHGILPPVYPEWLGARSFQEDHGTRFAYAAGAMANGIASAALVTALAKEGLLGFFGAAGLPYDGIVEGLDAIAARLHRPAAPWGANLIHAPQEPDLEWRTARLYVERGVRFVEASAFLALTPAVVYAGCKGIAEGTDGQVVRPRALFAKVSRPELARRFMAPAPREMLQALRDGGHLTPDEARLAVRIPLATDVTAEADSGGHTDNRPLAVLVPMMLALRAEVARESALAAPPRLGAAGGLGTPAAVAAAFALGADYVVTGTVNQSAVEAGLSEDGKRLLAEADAADVAMAAAADMFEMGVKVQVLRRGTLFAARANRLFEIYRNHDGLDQIPPAVREELEQKLLGASFESVWDETEAYWRARDPGQIARAQADPKHRMALLFRWYLGMSSRWAIRGETRRRGDYQIWCGPAMGAFNDWARGSFLEEPAQRTVDQIAFNLLEGAAVVTRAQALRAAGVAVPAEAFCFRPRRLRLG